MMLYNHYFKVETAFLKRFYKRKLAFLLSLIPCFLYSQVALTVRLPTNTPQEGTLYLAGNFNSWQPDDARYQLNRIDLSTASINLNCQHTTLVFKVTRGSWEKVEVAADGSDIPNRMLNCEPAKSIEMVVKNWSDMKQRPSSAAPNVVIWKADFEFPTLQTQRTIRIYLPPDYHKKKQERYPVVYMHDGQNLFDAATSYSGEWQIDEFLNQRAAEGLPVPIIVGIDHANEARMDEYSPWQHPKYGGGKGDAYVKDLAEYLKPAIDKAFRTLPNRENTCIMGSSMGGLISLYAVAHYPQIFGKVGAFSPSLWFSEGVFEAFENHQFDQSLQVYLLAGGDESENMTSDLFRLYKLLEQKHSNLLRTHLEIDSQGKHSEAFWSKSLEPAFNWLL